MKSALEMSLEAQSDLATAAQSIHRAYDGRFLSPAALRRYHEASRAISTALKHVDAVVEEHRDSPGD